uniref:Uncharacterized protein n=1 Tax=Triticum urartu TaxID=4572 RepID=A0A8R7UPS7_TRIUA
MLVSTILNVASLVLDFKDNLPTLYSHACIFATSSQLYATLIKFWSTHLLTIRSSIISCTLQPMRTIGKAFSYPL